MKIDNEEEIKPDDKGESESSSQQNHIEVKKKRKNSDSRLQIINNTRISILKELNGLQFPQSIYDISRLTGISHSEIHRQIKILRRLSLVKEHKKGKRSISYTINSMNPASSWLLNLGSFLEVTRTENLFSAIKELENYYFSGFFVFSLNKKDLIIILPEDDDISLAIVEAYSNVEPVKIQKVPKNEFALRDYHPYMLPPLVTLFDKKKREITNIKDHNTDNTSKNDLILEKSNKEISNSQINSNIETYQATEHNMASVEQALIDGILAEDDRIVELLLGKSALQFTFDDNLLFRLNSQLPKFRNLFSTKAAYLSVIRQAQNLKWSNYYLYDLEKDYRGISNSFREIVYKKMIDKNPKEFQEKDIVTMVNQENILRYSAQLGVPESQIEQSIYFFETVFILTEILEKITSDFLINGLTVYNLKYLPKKNIPAIITNDLFFEVSSNAREELILAFADLQDRLFSLKEVTVLESNNEPFPIGGITIDPDNEGFMLTRLVGTKMAGRPISSFFFNKDRKKQLKFTKILEIPIRIFINDDFEKNYGSGICERAKIVPYFSQVLGTKKEFFAPTTKEKITSADIAFQMELEPFSTYNLQKWVTTALLKHSGLNIPINLENLKQDIDSEYDNAQLRYKLDPQYLLVRREFTFDDIIDFLKE